MNVRPDAPHLTDQGYGSAMHSARSDGAKSRNMARFLHHYSRWIAHSESSILERHMAETSSLRLAPVVEAAIDLDFNFGRKGKKISGRCYFCCKTCPLSCLTPGKYLSLQDLHSSMMHLQSYWSVGPFFSIVTHSRSFVIQHRKIETKKSWHSNCFNQNSIYSARI